MVASKIFTSSKGVPKQGDHQEKTNEKDKAMWDAKFLGNKESRLNCGKKKDCNGYKGQNVLNPEMMENYWKENRCFRCGAQGHSYHNYPKKKDFKDTPQVTHVLSTGEKEEEDGGCTPLCYLWGKSRDQSTLILLDQGSTHKFISQELAHHLEIH